MSVQKLVLERKGKFVKNSIAIICGFEQITYGEFDRLTDLFASGLRRMNYGPGDAVIIKMKRSAKLAIAMFGVFKSGVTFVPVAYDISEERLNYIYSSSKAKLIIDDDIYQDFINCEELLAPVMAKENDPAMILYTSGSTGEPKGVVQSQKSLEFLFRQFPNEIKDTGIEVSEFDSILARMNHTYAGTYHYEYPAAFLNGKKLVLLKEDEKDSVEDISKALESGGKFCVTFLPSQLKVFLENEIFCKVISHISEICFLAENIPDGLIEKIKKSVSSCKMISLYGMTECFAIGWEDVEHTKAMVSSPKVEMHIVDEEGKILPYGEKGQIIVSSPTVFDNYLLNDSVAAKQLFLTKELIINGKRFFCTGDVGIMEKDKTFSLFGRNDRMVKFHGQRIELPEVEKVLNSYPDIRNCCVVLSCTNKGNKLLAAYYEEADGKEVSSSKLREYLRLKLPPFMVPSYFKKMEKLPRGATGKIDYGCLSKTVIELADIADSSVIENLETKEEHLVAKNASEILKISERVIFSNTNLMSLGMDSLNAVLLISALSKAGYSLSLEDFVLSGSVKEIAEKMVPKKENNASSDRKDVSDLVRCTDMQDLWIRNDLQIVSRVMVFRGIEEEEIKKKAMQLPLNHPSLRSSFIEIDGKWHTKVLKTHPVKWEYNDLRAGNECQEKLSDKQQKYISMKHGLLQANFDEKDLVYINAIRVKDDKTVLLLRVDHRVVDGMSERIILDELICDEFRQESDSYIEYLNYTGDLKAKEKAISFWKEYLQGVKIPKIPKNPFSKGIPNYKHIHIQITGEEEKNIREFCKANSVSISAFVFCQYGRAIMDVLGIDETVINLAVSGRSIDVSNMDGTVGCIVNIAPVRISRNDGGKDFMKSYLLADRYSFLNAEDIYIDGLGLKEVPPLLPFISSEIFPKTIIKDKYENMDDFSYSMFNRGDFLWEDGDGIHLMLHPDIDYFDEETIDKIIEKTSILLKNH